MHVVFFEIALDHLSHCGVVIDEKDGTVSQVAWDSPAFKAKLTESAQILAVNGAAYGAEAGEVAATDAEEEFEGRAVDVRPGQTFQFVDDIV